MDSIEIDTSGMTKEEAKAVRWLYGKLMGGFFPLSREEGQEMVILYPMAVADTCDDRCNKGHKGYPVLWCLRPKGHKEGPHVAHTNPTNAVGYWWGDDNE